MKKLIIVCMLILPLGMMAQEVKIAYVDFQTILMALPEMNTVEKTMADLQEQYAKEFRIMQDDYEKKTNDYLKQQDELAENIKNKRIQDIQDLQERMQSFAAFVDQSMPEKQNELLKPLYEKVDKAIKEVGEENKYSCILPINSFHYVSSNLIDATPLVKTKLGI